MSATGQAAAAATGDAGGGQGGESAQGAAGFDAAAVQQALQETRGGVDDLRAQFGQFLESAPWQQQEAAAGEDAGAGEIDLSFLDEAYTNPGFGDAERAQQQAQFAQALQQHAAQAVAPVQQQMQEMAREQKIRDLVGEFPQFQDAEYAQKIAGPNGLAVQYAEAIGDPKQAMNPGFWRLVHMAHTAAEAANAEGQQGGADASQAAHLEGGGGSGPGGGQQVDIAGQILGAKRGASVLPY